MVQLGEMRADVQLDFQDAKEESEKVQSEAKEENEKVKNETLCMMRAITTSQHDITSHRSVTSQHQNSITS